MPRPLNATWARLESKYMRTFAGASRSFPIEGGAEERVADGLSYSLNFVVADRGLYFLTVRDAPEKTSIDFLEFATGTRTRIVDLRKPFWFGMALSPDGKSLLFSLVNGAGSNLMIVENFR